MGWSHTESDRIVGTQVPSPTYLRLQKQHEQHIEFHGSPARQKFLYEFGAAAANQTFGASSPSASPKKGSPIAHGPLPTRFEGLTFETTNQYRYMGYGDALKLPAFSPETKHRVLKAPTHEFQEALFKEWNTFGKPK